MTGVHDQKSIINISFPVIQNIHNKTEIHNCTKTTGQTEKEGTSSNTSQHPESTIPFTDESCAQGGLSWASEEQWVNVDAAFSATTLRVLPTNKKSKTILNVLSASN